MSDKEITSEAELELMAAVNEALIQADEGKLTPHAEVKKLLSRWVARDFKDLSP